MNRTIGLFFGSFNPIHIGHLAIAEYIAEYSDTDQLWFVVSPHNPLKNRANLLADHHRLEMVYRAIGDDMRFRVCDIEFRMPKPSYTSDSLIYLTEKYPAYTFRLIIGSDNLASFHKWKNSEYLSENYTRIVYPRHGENMEEFYGHPKVQILKAPRIEISSSFIRKAIAEGKQVKYFVPEKVYAYIEHMNFYR